MTLLVSAGGTGGGIYPALAVVAAIRKLSSESKVVFVGSVDGLENTLIDATDTQLDAYETVQAGPLHGVNPLRAVQSLVRLGWGVLQSFGVLRRHHPRALFLTGGWVTLPVALAAFVRRVPIITFVPDIEPGLTLKVLGRLAQVVTATTDDTKAFFPHKRLVATGYPLRPDLQTASRADGMTAFGLDPALPTILVFGGSRGARSINTALLDNIEEVLAKIDAQFIHITGSLDWKVVQSAHQKLPEWIQERYHVFEYLHNIGSAMAAADVVVSRAGASTLGEFPFFGLPAVLIPYPYAWRYQRVNAEWLVSRGAAILLEDETLPDTLAPTIVELVQDDDRRQQMADATSKLADVDGAQEIARVVLEEMERA